jgi:uncharacterized protein
MEVGIFDIARPQPELTANDTQKAPIATDGMPQIGKTYVLPARAGRAVRIGQEQTITIVNTHGMQVVDTWAFALPGLDEFLSMEHMRATLDRIMPRRGDMLFSNRRRPILQLIEDTSPGIHDTFIAACDIYRYRLLGVKTYHDNCTDNLRMAMQAIGLEAPEVPSPLNLFMNIPVRADHSIAWEPPVSKPGDKVTLRAMLDCVVVMSACPQDMVPINGLNCTPQPVSFFVSH